jgi:hypothetical protein
MYTCICIYMFFHIEIIIIYNINKSFCSYNFRIQYHMSSRHEMEYTTKWSTNPLKITKQLQIQYTVFAVDSWFWVGLYSISWRLDVGLWDCNLIVFICIYIYIHIYIILITCIIFIKYISWLLVMIMRLPWYIYIYIYVYIYIYISCISGNV